MFEAARLRAAAWCLRRQADALNDVAVRLDQRVRQSVDGGRWQGPSATRAASTSTGRRARLTHAAGDMRDLAARFDRRATQLEAEERARAAAAAAKA